MGPTLMNRCQPAKMDTKENRKMLKRIQILEEGKVPAKNTGKWEIEGPERRVARKECKRLQEEFEIGGFMAQKRAMEHCQKKFVGG